jgi:hypothetical protein
MPGLAARAHRLRQHLTMTIGALQPAEIRTFARPGAGYKKRHVRRLGRRLLCLCRDAIERRFAWQSRITTIFAGFTGLDMLVRLDLWHRFLFASCWSMHATVAVYLLSTVMLFVAEPLILHTLKLAYPDVRCNPGGDVRPGDHGRDILCYPSNSSQVSASDQGRVELDLAAAIEQPWVFCVLAPEQDGQWEIAIVAAEQRKFAGQR